MATETSTPQNDIKRAKEALIYFHNEALKYPENYRLSFEELCSSLQDMSHGAFLEGFGFAITSVDISESRVKSALEGLADQGEGKLPSNWNGFFQALSGEATKITFGGAANAVLVGTARDIGAGLEQVGKTVIDTAKNAAGLVTFVPYLAFGALALFIYFEVKKKAA